MFLASHPPSAGISSSSPTALKRINCVPVKHAYQNLSPVVIVVKTLEKLQLIPAEDESQPVLLGGVYDLRSDLIH